MTGILRLLQKKYLKKEIKYYKIKGETAPATGRVRGRAVHTTNLVPFHGGKRGNKWYQQEILEMV